MPQLLEDLLQPLHQAVAADDERQRSCNHATAAAMSLAGQLPLVHRTGARATGRSIIRDRRLLAKNVGSHPEHALGHDLAVYLYLGAGAYPHGNIALLFTQSLGEYSSATFTPFDTGALDEKLAPVESSAAWDAAARVDTLRRYLGHGRDLAGFAGPYMAAHFLQPADYVMSPQRGSTDFSVYHGLESRPPERRDWTIEVQIHEDIPLTQNDQLVAVLLDNLDIFASLPRDYQRITHVVRSADDESSDFMELIAKHIQGMVQ